MNLQQKIEYSLSLLKKAEPLALHYHPQGFYLAFSGGKDSQALYELAEIAGVKFQAHMNLTSVDPPQVLKFVRRHYPEVILHSPKESIYKLIPKKKCLPTRVVRWCCTLLKEGGGAGTVTLLGIRKEESTRRSKRKEMETGNRKFSGNFDQFSRHRQTEIECVNGKDKIMVSPLLEWTEKDVWDFLRLRGLPHCQLYDMGYRRIGCIMCPMSSHKTIMRERKMFPGVERAYKKAIARLIEAYPPYGKALNHDVDLIFEWWVSRKNMKRFIAEEITQLKIKF